MEGRYETHEVRPTQRPRPVHSIDALKIADAS